MAGFYSDEEIQKVIDASDLVQLVSEITPVKQRGNDFKCCCPFHNEKTPSFHIDAERGLWHCFGCGEGGGIIKFVERTQDMSFPEALRYLADRAHIQLSDISDKKSRMNKGQRARLKDICAETANFYHLKLMRDTSDGPARAREYLSGRNLGGKIPKTWLLGFAPGCAQLVRHLYSKGFKYDEMVMANVAVKGRDGKIHDRFFNRVMFPIRDVSGDVIAFGGRVIGPGEPKYLNSQETPLFHKSKVLYGLDKAKVGMATTGVAVVVEGYTDVIACHAAGMNNVVATLGTALTRQHIRTLSRHAKDAIVYLFDGDVAGQRAADRALGFIDSSITPEGSRNPIRLEAVTLPDNMDPAEFIDARGVDELREIIASSKQLIQYGIDRRLEQNDLATPEGRSMAFSQAMQILAPIKTSVLAQQYASIIASATNTNETVALEALRTLKVPVERSSINERQPVGSVVSNSAQTVNAGVNASVHSTSHAPNAKPYENSVQVASPPAQPKDNRLRFEQNLLSLCLHEPVVAFARINTIASIKFHSAFHMALSNAIVEELGANPSATSAELLAKVSIKVPAAGSYLTQVSYDRAVDPARMADFLCEELQIGDIEESIATLRAQPSKQSTNDNNNEMFEVIIAMQRDLNARKAAHKPL